MRKTGIVLAAAALLAACTPQAENRPPKQLLSLTVSGLTGVDHYRFTGTSRVSVGGAAAKPVNFQGRVSDHRNIKVQTSDNAAVPGIDQPLKLLGSVQKTAGRTELVPERSGNRTAVLRIEADAFKAKKLWADRLRGQLERLREKVPTLQSGAMEASAAGKSRQSALEREWKAELMRSQTELNDMLKTLRVKSVYMLTINRAKLLPMRLQERTELRYDADGVEQRETRTTDMAFRTNGR